jgi:quercetin dioxygenase-like cupin family protein
MTMLTVKTTELDLIQTSNDSLGHRVNVAFPINKYAGAADSGVVYFEIAPGDKLATHTDSEEEILYIVAGKGEAHAGDEAGVLSAGDLAVIPAMVPHGIANVGDETLKVVGFFAGATIVSTFDEPLQPIGLRQMEQGAPAPVSV